MVSGLRLPFRSLRLRGLRVQGLGLAGADSFWGLGFRAVDLGFRV